MFFGGVVGVTFGVAEGVDTGAVGVGVGVDTELVGVGVGSSSSS